MFYIVLYQANLLCLLFCRIGCIMAKPFSSLKGFLRPSFGTKLAQTRRPFLQTWNDHNKQIENNFFFYNWECWGGGDFMSLNSDHFLAWPNLWPEQTMANHEDWKRSGLLILDIIPNYGRVARKNKTHVTCKVDYVDYDDKQNWRGLSLLAHEPQTEKTKKRGVGKERYC